MPIEKWIERTFAEKPDASLAPNILERLRGTPARLRQRLQGLSKICLTFRQGESWTIQENVGHLGDLEPLWKARHDQILAGAEEMSPADVTNPATWEAGHNRSSLVDLLDRFQKLRQRWLDALEQLSRPDFEKSSLHPRLKTSMRLIDLCHFVAEHDDHHLARITELIQLQGGSQAKAQRYIFGQPVPQMPSRSQSWSRYGATAGHAPAEPVIGS